MTPDLNDVVEMALAVLIFVWMVGAIVVTLIALIWAWG